MINLYEFIKLFYDKKFRIIFLVIFVPIIILSIYWLTIFQTNQHKETRLPKLQSQCDAQSKIIFEKIQSKNIVVIYNYKNYFNDYLGKCYILLHGEGAGATGTSDKLLDANTEEEIATCESHTTAPEIDFCRFNGGKSYYSINNFNNFIKIYLENK